MNFLDLSRLVKESENRKGYLENIKRINPFKFQSKEEQKKTGETKARPVYQTI